MKIIAGKMLPQVKPRTIAQRVRTYGQVPVVQAARMKTSNGINMTNPLNILFVDDDEDFGEGCARWFQRQGHHVAISTSGQDGLDLCSHHDFDIAILDWNLPGLSGLQLVQRMRGSHADTEVIVLTGDGTINNAVESMRLGVFDFQTKTFPIGDLERRCLAAVKRRKLKKENTQLRELITRSRKPAHQMIGQSEPMRKLFSLIDRVAPTDKSVLIQGETGTGKELVAAAIRAGSSRADRPLVTLNCAALPEQLMESELFGHGKGSFTGATAMKPGLNVMSLELPPPRHRGEDIELLIEHFLGDDYELDAASSIA